MTLTTTYSHSNRMGRVVLLAMEEVLGYGGVKDVLDCSSFENINKNLLENYALGGVPATEESTPKGHGGESNFRIDTKNSFCDKGLGFPFEHVSRLQIGLENVYGPRAGRGLGMRVGRACLKYGLREFGSELGLDERVFQLLPVRTKIKVGSEAFAALFNDFADQRVSLESDEQNIYWHIEHCPLCWNRRVENLAADVQPNGPCCHVAVGLLQEALHWISGGKYYEVVEEKCIACGDSKCTIVINRTPFG